jgi:hypothetical protein
VHTDFPGVSEYRWNDCDETKISAYLHAHRQVSLDGGQPPHSTVDARQQSILLPGGCVSGALSVVGADQGFRLGEQLRARYESSMELNATDIDVRSTNVARCVRTARAVLGGLFPHSLKSAEAISIRTAPSSAENLTCGAATAHRS